MHTFQFKYTIGDVVTINGMEDMGPFTVTQISIEINWYSYLVLGDKFKFYIREEDLEPYKE